MTSLRVLIIDDHLVTCKGYEYFFENATNDGLIPNFEIVFAHDCKSAHQLILSNNKEKGDFNIILLDVQLPPYPDEKIFSGEDLGLLIRSNKPKTRIILQTAISDKYLLYNIFKNLNPEAILIKSDLVEENFVICIKEVLKDIPYYSKTFSKLLRNQFSQEYVLDQDDRELLYLLNIGISSKEIPKRLIWSSSKVEKRKRLMREKFGVDDRNIISLLNAARKAGFL